ncbi:RidA family protein [Deinococcus wulumuqiensis]|uniref:RutC family protein n=2 Tax=Deinococcus wulumuqiensis TaxID=980427 RepID=A0AAV4K4L7_9DEIO|nr:RidA family protein [Deinococcus wulumuqiensis]QII20414.1 RidA family protein [Deinococcus wulumuqiensis R12]GGI81981.1 RutC family protein [Deinococcus wulumuqiensis]GGP29396.1 RutC family protein [Deinococcus wulumuqiensis]
MKPALFLLPCLLASCTLTGGPVKSVPSSGTLPFSEAVQVGQTLYLSGQLGLDAQGQLVPGGVRAETLQALSNIEATLTRQGYRREHLVKCMVMLRDMKDFAAMNEVYGSWMRRPYPVRSTFGGADLALNANVEIECVAAR